MLVALAVVVLQKVGSYLESHVLALAGGEVYALKTFQFLHGARYHCLLVMDVHLYRLHAIAAAGVADAHRGSELAAVERQLIAAQTQLAILE